MTTKTATKTKLEKHGWICTSQDRTSYKKTYADGTYYISFSLLGPGKGMYGNRGMKAAGNLNGPGRLEVNIYGSGSERTRILHRLADHAERIHDEQISPAIYLKFINARRLLGALKTGRFYGFPPEGYRERPRRTDTLGSWMGTALRDREWKRAKEEYYTWRLARILNLGQELQRLNEQSRDYWSRIPAPAVS